MFYEQIGSSGWALFQWSTAGVVSHLDGDMAACRLIFDRWRSRIMFRERTRIFVHAWSSNSFGLAIGGATLIDKIEPTTLQILTNHFTPYTFTTFNPSLPTSRFAGIVGGTFTKMSLDAVPAAEQGIIVSANSQIVQVLIVRL
jgi:hypothetical protein